MNGTRPDWFPQWQDRYVAVIGGGASVNRAEINSLQGRLPVVVINESHQLAPWADALYSCDLNWWTLRQLAVKKFKGLKITADPRAPKLLPDLKLNLLRFRDQTPGQPIKYLLMDTWGEIGTGQGSGFQVVNWLAQIGVKGIMLIGFDGCIYKDKIHWHGQHPVELRNPDQSVFVGWKMWFEDAAPKLAKLGIEVINTSMVSTIGKYYRLEVDRALTYWQL